jgi:enamine deaminase RidA (YjgF/YER057c/UK114 family)
MTNTATTPQVARINPGTWQQAFRYDQAQLRPAPATLLTLAGQGAITPDGALVAPDDTAAQLAAAMDNVVDLLDRAGMGLADVFRMTVYVTDMGAALAAYGAITERLDAAGATPPATLVGVAALAVPGMVVEIEATAGR